MLNQVLSGYNQLSLDTNEDYSNLNYASSFQICEEYLLVQTLLFGLGAGGHY